MTALVGIAALRVYTELLPAGVFGAANLIMTALGLGLQVFVAPLTNVQLRYHTQAEARGEGDRYTHETLRWALRAVAIPSVLIVLVFGLCQVFAWRDFGLVVVVTSIAWLLATAIRNVLMSRIQAERRRRAYVGFMVLEALLIVSLTFFALRYAATLNSFLVGQTLAALVLLAALIVSMRWPTRNAGVTRDTDFWPQVKAYGLPFMPLALMAWLANLADRYALAFLLGTQATGLYVAPFAIASRGMGLANSALCDLFRPILFDAENRRDTTAARRTFQIWLAASAGLSVAGLLLLGLVGAVIVHLLLAEAYRDGAVLIMLWVGSAYAVSGLTQILENRLLSLGHSANLLPPMALGAVANIGFSVWLISRNGVIGAAQASCASFIVQGVVTLFFLRKALKKTDQRISVRACTDGT